MAVTHALMTEVYLKAIQPALRLLPPQLDTRGAHCLMLAIGAQESRLVHRFQVLNTPGAKGPARGLWQNEASGGVRGVMRHASVSHIARGLCAARNVAFEERTVWAAMEFDDVLAAGWARLILLADPHALPPLTATPEETWDCYIFNWRPGKPHRDTWDAFHRLAYSWSPP